MLSQGCVESLDEVAGYCLGSFDVVLHNGKYDANQRGIGAVITNGIGDHVRLGRVLAGDHAITGLIPVKDQAFRVALLNDVFIGFDQSAAGNVDVHYAGCILNPSASRQAVLRGVGSSARALGPEVSDKQVGRDRMVGICILTGKQLIGLENVLHLFFDNPFAGLRPGPDLPGHLAQGAICRNDFGA